jgi:hypothetical protein
MRKWAQIIGLLAAICTLIGLLAGGLRFLSRSADSVFPKGPVIVLRDQRLEELPGHSKYFIKFSVINPRDKPITLNMIALRIGDYAYSSSNPAEHWIAFQRFSREIKLDFVGHPEGKPLPLLVAQQTEDSMGASEFAVVTERGSIRPSEQIDVDLLVDVSRPEKFRSKYPTIWSLGGQVEVRYEDQSLKQDKVLYPASRGRRYSF